MRFLERRDFTYDPNLFRLADTQTALKIYAEWIQRYTPQPQPVFFEVDRSVARIDPLWHMPLTDRTQFSRELKLPTVNIGKEKKQWTLDPKTNVLTPKQRDVFLLAHNHLEKFDYWPLKGDFIYYNGYRFLIVEVEIPREAYWQQTNVWMGLNCHSEIALEGDAKPMVNPGVAGSGEHSSGPILSAE